MTAATEAGLKAHGREYRKLDEDLKNCFSEMCRVGLQEDILDSEELLGTDLSQLAPYFQMAYVESECGGWFKVDAARGTDEQWVFLQTEEGVRQGAPLSCFLCGLGLKRAQLAAERALDEQHGVQRYEGDTDQAR
eukprot:SAG11_NODE_1340_length_5165_cov_3.807146_3_plen_135_part_00